MQLLPIETSKLYKYVAGIDEAGRGPLAGPLVVAGVILDKNKIRDIAYLKEPIKKSKEEQNSTNNDVASENKQLYLQINDSKKLTPKKREQLSDFIKENAVCYVIEEIDVQTIDEINISKANLSGFEIVANKLNEKIKNQLEHIITDFFPIPNWEPDKQTNIVRGDAKSISVAAASIIAKVHRDSLMMKFHERYPLYEFNRHKGYGTKLHMELIEKYGPCEIHRKSFYPITKFADIKKWIINEA